MSYKFADSLLLASCQQNVEREHVEFYSKNKFEKLVHLVGFIIRIYHDARSPGRQIVVCILNIKTAFCSQRSKRNEICMWERSNPTL